MQAILSLTPIILFHVAIWGIGIYALILLIKALRKYLGDRPSPQQAAVRRSLGETIKTHRARCGMTQEYVAEQLGVSRQAVSKWESGQSDPSTSNLLALAKLFGVSPAELLEGVGG